MQVDLAFFEKLLTTWIQFTQENLPYAICLAVAVWLVTAIFYSMRIGALKGRVQAVEKARAEAQTQIETQQQSIQQLEQTVEAGKAEIERINAEVSAETQRAEALETRLIERNGQFAQTLQRVADTLTLGDLGLPASDDVAGDSLWNQRDSVLERLASRVQDMHADKARAEQDLQVEIAKRAEKELTIAALQARLDGQAEQLSKLERAAADRAEIEQQLADARRQLDTWLQQRDSQLRVAERVEAVAPTAEPAVVTMPEPAQSVVAPVAPAPQPEPVAPVVAEAPNPVDIKPEVKLEPKPEPVAVQAVAAEPPKPAAPAKAAKPSSVEKASGGMGGKLKGLFGNAIAQMEKIDELLGTQSKPMIDPENQAPIQQRRVEPAKVEVAPAVSAQPAAEAKVQDDDNRSKLSGMFGFGKKQPKAEAPAPQSQPEVVPVQSQTPPETDKKASKMGGLLGRFKKG